MQHETRQKLMEMLERTGHVLVVEDFDDIAALDRCAEQVVDPQSGIDSPLTQHAVYFRGVPVYPLTLAHFQYIDDAPALLEIDADEQSIVALWLCTLPTIPDELYEPTAARKALKKWSRRSPWTATDVEAIMALRFGHLRDKGTEDGKRGDMGALVGLLAREYGETPDYWMREAPIGMIEVVVADWQRNQNAQASAYQRSAVRGKPVPPAPTPKYEAVKRFRECAERIEAKWRSVH